MESLIKLHELAGSEDGKKQVGQVLKLARLTKGLTQAGAAEKLSINTKTLSSYETGRNRPSPYLFEKMAELYEVELKTMYGRATKSDMSIDKPNKLHRIPIMSGKQKYSSRREFFMAEEPLGFGLADVGNPEDYIYLQVPDDSLTDYRVREGDNVLIKKLEKPKDGNVVVVLLEGDPLVRKYETITSDSYKLRVGDFTGNEDMIVTNGAVDGKMVEHLGVVKMVMFVLES